MQNILRSTALNYSSVCSSCERGVTQIVQFIYNEQQQTTLELNVNSPLPKTTIIHPSMSCAAGSVSLLRTQCSLSLTVRKEQN
jgi:hypothetical protein